MNKIVITAIALCSLQGYATTGGDSAPLWLNHPAISPDGKTVAFSYKGDIYTVPATGGEARAVTSNPAYDSYPVWSPDSKTIAFASDRDGTGMDVYAISSQGGRAVRLTTAGGSETPKGFLNDSTVLFSAGIMPSTTIRSYTGAQLYSVPLRAGARPHMVLPFPVGAVDVDASGRMLYQDKKSYEDVLRKHERSSGTADIWLDDHGRYTRLTTFNGNDHNPVWDGKDNYVYLSERGTDGTLNIWRGSINGGDPVQVTAFTRHPVRSLSRATDGTLAFSWNGEIYTMAVGAPTPTKMKISIAADDYAGAPNKSIRSNGATDLAVSPDGSEVAFVMRGDIYVTSVKYATTRRITDTPGQERCLSFSKDGRTIVYDSERDGKWALYTATIKDSKEKHFTYATAIEEKLLYAGGNTAQQPVFSPDGKKVAFLEDRVTLRVLDVATKKVVTALDGKYNYSYSDGDISFVWNPDSQWLLIDYIGIGGWNNTDIAAVRADGSEVIDLTESGYSDGNPRWAMGGRALIYTTGRYGMKSHGSWGNQSDVVFMALDESAWEEINRTEEEAALVEDAEKEDKDDKADKSEKSEKKDKKDKKSKKDKADKKDEPVKPHVFDFANRRYRTKRLTERSSSMGDSYLSDKGDKLYYVALATEGGGNLYVRDLRKDETRLLAKGVSGGFEYDAKGDNLFVLSGSGIKKVSLKDGKEETVSFEAEYDRDPAAEREYIFDHMLSQVRDKFYDVNLHGVDWDAYGNDYRRFLPHINNNYDYADMLSEILGELNASHTGGRYFEPSKALPTAVLGAFYDEDYRGEGLKVAEVLPRSPLASAKANVKPGDVITAINGNEIGADADYNLLLQGKVNKKVRLTVRSVDGKNRTVTVRAISAGAQSGMLYHRWVERNQQLVDSLSGGRIGYVHIQGMDSPSFREVYSELLGRYRNREAVIVDTRYNGGGWLHNDVALLLSGKEYVRYAPRGRYIGSDPFSQWTKPSVMLTNEYNYSDAHGTPYVYKTLGIGKIVGAPVPGTMTAVWWETQIDPSLVFGIPQVTSLDRNGHALENRQLDPDIEVYNSPEDVVTGRDRQIEAAVTELLKQLNK